MIPPDFCDKAKEIYHERAEQHGNYLLLAQKTAALWSAYLGVEITDVDVGHMMSQVKHVRDKNGPYNPDDGVDDVGWAAIAASCKWIRHGTP